MGKTEKKITYQPSKSSKEKIKKVVDFHDVQVKCEKKMKSENGKVT